MIILLYNYGDQLDKCDDNSPNPMYANATLIEDHGVVEPSTYQEVAQNSE